MRCFLETSCVISLVAIGAIARLINIMRLGVALIFISSFVTAYGMFGPELQQKLRAREDKCIGDQEVLRTIAKIDRLRRNHRLPEDGSLDDFAMCILKTYYIYNADGTINTDVDKHWLILDDREKKSYSSKCIARTGVDEKDRMRKIFRCYLNSGIYILDPTPRTRALRPRSLF